MNCHQCETQAMFMVGVSGNNQTPLCLHCYTKLKQVETDHIKTLHQVMEFCDKQIAFQQGFVSSPITIKAATEIGDISLNHINISDSKIGMVNTGNIHAESIALSIDSLINNNEKEIADALKILTEAISNESQINKENEAKILELVSYIAEESIKSSQSRRINLITASIKKLGKLCGSYESVKMIWEQVHPIIKHYFGY